MKNAKEQPTYRAIISSDWNQCLAPCGPFDPIIYCHQGLTSDITKIFKEYTENKISLGNANNRIYQLIPESISIAQMDDYLSDSFVTYNGVPELIEWCNKENILFMINTTGLMGYFQRIYANNLLPNVPVISANSLIRYPDTATDPSRMYNLKEIEDKGENTARAIGSFTGSEHKIVIIGDSGGDGPHFEWGKSHGAYMIGSMAKHSLVHYCKREKIKIDLFFGLTYATNEKRMVEHEMLFDFMELSAVIESIFE